MISGGAPVASLMISGGVSRPIGHRTNIVSVKKWGGQSPPKPPLFLRLCPWESDDPCRDPYGDSRKNPVGMEIELVS